MSKKPNNKNYWLDQQRNITGMVYVLWALCAGLLVAEFFYSKHPHFGWDGWFGFYALFGFAAYCFIVLSAKGLRRWIKRDEDYYTKDLSQRLGKEPGSETEHDDV